MMEKTIVDIPYSFLYEKSVLIRKFETRLLELFSAGKLFGTTHTYVGQEATAVSSITQLNDRDIVFSNHRCHGHYLVRNDDPEGLLAEIMGKEHGVCSGRGGSQHLCRGNFFSNGIQGGYLPNALGMAFAEKYHDSGTIVVAFIGDGTLGEGAVYETLNLASLWQVPLLIVVENNRYAQTTPIERNLAGSIVKRVEAFDILVDEIESNDVAELYPIFGAAIDYVRNNSKPFVQVVHTYRLNAHSKGDDFRDVEEIDRWRKKDPLGYFFKKLDVSERERIDREVESRLRAVEERVDQAPFARFLKKTGLK
jgi:TPP-dependent pyruvate/acetoin dehydrogenase alpha subunit